MCTRAHHFAIITRRTFAANAALLVPYNRGMRRATDQSELVATLQEALSRAHGRIRELEMIADHANTRASEAIELADRVQMDALMRETEARAAQERAGAMRTNADVSP